MKKTGYGKGHKMKYGKANTKRATPKRSGRKGLKKAYPNIDK